MKKYALFFSMLCFCACGTPRVLTSIDVSPATQNMTTLGETTQYTATGHFTRSPATQDITSSVTWSSSDTDVAAINSSGIATANQAGQTTITASSSTSTKGAMLVSGVSILTVGQTTAVLTVQITGNGTVVSAPLGINCGVATNPVCGFPFNVGTSVVLTSSAQVTWTGCDTFTNTSCTVDMTADRIVKAQF